MDISFDKVIPEMIMVANNTRKVICNDLELRKETKVFNLNWSFTGIIQIRTLPSLRRLGDS